MNTPISQKIAPKIGLVLNSTGVFNAEVKKQSDRVLREYFKGLVASGAIDRQSIITEQIFNPHEALAVADRLAAACVDLVVLANIAFPNGQIFLTMATHPGLSKTPIAVIAEPEADIQEWSTNAWCGAIMNNHVAKQLGRPVVLVPGPFSSEAFQAEFARLLRVAGTIRFMRRDFLGRFGDAPGGFHSATGDQLIFARVLGTRVDTIDLTAVMETYRSGKTRGYLGDAEFTDHDVEQTVKQICEGRSVQVDRPMLERCARLYQAYRAIVKANGYTSASFRCWPENNEPFIGISACLAMTLLLTNGDVTSTGCEGDWPTAVVQTLGTLLSGKPAACLDWVNYTGGSDIVQLGHCGAGICGQMATGECRGVACDAVTAQPVMRQGGVTTGPALIGQFEFGVKTGLCIAPDRDGGLKILAVRGESTRETARGLIYSAADIRVSDYRKLNQIILDEGFPHHLAMAMGDVVEDVRMLCKYLGVKFCCPHDC